MEELWGWHCHSPKFQFHNQTHQNMYPHVTHKLLSNFITENTMISTEGSYNRKYWGYLNLRSLSCSHMFLRMWGQKGCVCVCVCVYVTWNPNILHQAVNNRDPISQSEQLKTCIGCHVQKHWNTWPINNTQHCNHVFMRPNSRVFTGRVSTVSIVWTVPKQQVYQQRYCSLTANVLMIWHYWNNYIYKNLLETNVITCLVLVFTVIILSLNI
jgi:hypothetical protein